MLSLWDQLTGLEGNGLLLGRTCKMEYKCIFVIFVKGIQFVLDHAKTTCVINECLVHKVMQPVSLWLVVALSV